MLNIISDHCSLGSFGVDWFRSFVVRQAIEMGLRKRASKDAGDAADTLPAAASLKGAGGPPALIDAKSRADYKKEFDNHRLQNKHATGE